MPTQVFIYGGPGLWPGRCAVLGPYELERALNDFLKGDGEVTWDGDEHSGPGWHVDLLLNGDVDIDGVVQRLTAFLRGWGVPDGPLSFRLVRGNEESGLEQRRIIVPGR